MFSKVFFASGTGIVRSEPTPEEEKVEPRPDRWAIWESLSEDERDEDPTFLQPTRPRRKGESS